jgi:hypothetical protein
MYLMNNWCCYITVDFATTTSQNWVCGTQDAYVESDDLISELLYDERRMSENVIIWF